MSQREQNKRNKEKRKRLGLCLTCSRKATKGLLQCRVCLAKSREIRMARYPLFCPECRKLVNPEYSMALISAQKTIDGRHQLISSVGLRDIMVGSHFVAC